MFGISARRRIGGRFLCGAGLPAGVGLGALAGVLVPAMPWIAVLVAGPLAVMLGIGGFLCSGEVFTAACPCCQSRIIATAWRPTVQCRRCRTMCALAALRRSVRRVA